MGGGINSWDTVLFDKNSAMPQRILMSRALDLYLRLQILEYFFTVLIYKIFRPELVLKLDIYTLSESTIIVRFVSKMSKNGPNI